MQVSFFCVAKLLCTFFKKMKFYTFLQASTNSPSSFLFSTFAVIPAFPCIFFHNNPSIFYFSTFLSLPEFLCVLLFQFYWYLFYSTFLVLPIIPCTLLSWQSQYFSYNILCQYFQYITLFFSPSIPSISPVLLSSNFKYFIVF